MIGLDTNVLVRYLAQDDPKQSRHATRLIEGLAASDPGFVPMLVLVETVWVLDSCYAAEASRIEQVVETLLRADAIRVEQAELVWRALRRFRSVHGDLADALIVELAHAAGCKVVYSFDRGAVKRSGMTLLESTSSSTR